MNYQEITVKCDRQNVDHLTEILENLDALAITLKDAADQPIFSSGVEEVDLWDEILISALFGEETDMQPIIEAIQPHPYHINIIPDQPWEDTWKKDFQRQSYQDRLWIYPSWDVPEQRAPHSLVLDPGLAFGTGKHATTHLCLQWLAETIQAQNTVIDFGCGSGILAIAALKLGAKSVVAVDIDPQAIESTQANAAQNQIGSELKIYLPDQVPTVQADIVIANILANPLIELSTTLASLVKNNGLIALSGILSDQAERIIQAYAPWFRFQTIRQQDEWVLLIGEKRTLPLRQLITSALEAYFEQLDGEKPANLYDMVLEEVELPLLKMVMNFASGNQSKAAAFLGMSRGTLRKKLQHYQLDE